MDADKLTQQINLLENEINYQIRALKSNTQTLLQEFKDSDLHALEHLEDELDDLEGVRSALLNEIRELKSIISRQ